MWPALTHAATGEPLLRVAMAAFVLWCVAWGVLRGVARLLVFLVSVACGGAAAWAVFRYAPGPLITWLHGFSPAAVNVAAAVAGVAVFLAVKRFPGSLIRAGGPPASRAKAGIVSLLPALLVVWGGAMGLRWGGSVARLRWVQSAVDSADFGRLGEPPVAVRLGRSATRGAFGNLFDLVDPLHSREASSLASLLVVRRDDAAWRRLLRQPGVAPVFELAPARRLLRDHDVTRALSYSHYSELLTLPVLTRAAAEPDVRAAVNAVAVEDVIQAALAGRILSDEPPRAEVIPE